MEGLFSYVNNITKKVGNGYNPRKERKRMRHVVSTHVDADVLQQAYLNVLETADEIKCARGGYTLHRGYFTRSIYAPFTVGGCNRGSLIKRKTEKTKISYEYYYKNRQLIMVKSFTEPLDRASESVWYKVEFIDVIDGREVGLTFDVNEYKDDFCIESTITGITLCEYENQHLKGIYSYTEDDQYERETIIYDEGKMMTVDYMSIWTFCRMLAISEKEKIRFIHDLTDCPIEYYFLNNPECVYPVSKINQQYYNEFLTDK